MSGGEQKPTPIDNQVRYRADGSLLQELLSRVDRHSSTINGPARRDLERYYFLLKKEELLFSLDEAGFIIEALLNQPIEANVVNLIWAVISDRPGITTLGERWQVDAEKVIAELRVMSLTEKFRVVDACERATHLYYAHDRPIDHEARKARLRAIATQVDLSPGF